MESFFEDFSVNTKTILLFIESIAASKFAAIELLINECPMVAQLISEDHLFLAQ